MRMFEDLLIFNESLYSSKLKKKKENYSIPSNRLTAQRPKFFLNSISLLCIYLIVYT